MVLSYAFRLLKFCFKVGSIIGSSIDKILSFFFNKKFEFESHLHQNKLISCFDRIVMKYFLNTINAYTPPSHIIVRARLEYNKYYYSLVWLPFRNKILNMHPQFSRL